MRRHGLKSALRGHRTTGFPVITLTLILSCQICAAAQDRDSTRVDGNRTGPVSGEPRVSIIASPDQIAALEQAVDDAPADPGRRLFFRLTGVTRRERLSGVEAPRLRGQIRLPLGPLVEAAVAAENDSGEPLGWNPSRGWYGADHVSGHVSLGSDKSESRSHLIAGRYRAVFGHGLLLGNGRQPIQSAGRAGISPRLRADIRGYAGFSERPTPAGVAVSMSPISGVGVGSFVSRERLTASTRSAPDGSVEIRDVSTSGLHASESARSRRGRISYAMLGGWALIRSERISVGLLVGRSAARSDYPPTDAVRNADGVMFSAAGVIRVQRCEMSGEAAIEPGTLVEVVARCRTDAGTVFGEWTRETRGPVGMYGRYGRLARTTPAADVLRAGWSRRFSDPGRSIRGRLAVSGGIVRPRRITAWTAGSSRRVRLKFEASRTPWKVSVSSVTGRRSRTLEKSFQLAGESSPRGRILASREEHVAAYSLMADVALGAGTSLRVGFMRSSVSVSGRPTTRATSGTSMSLEMERDNLMIAAGVLAVASTDCALDECSLLQSPRIYVYERGVQNAFGLASAGTAGFRGLLTAAFAPDGPVTLEMQIRHSARYHAELNELRAARIGAPPATTTLTVQLTIR